VTYSGNWAANNGAFNSGGSSVLAMDAGSTATVVFNGTGVTWIGYQDEWSGIAQVYLDGNLAAQVDTYSSPSKAQSPLYSVSGMGGGQHTLTIKVVGQKNPSSQGSWVWVDAFDVTPGGSTPTQSTPTSTPAAPSGSATTRIEQNAAGISYSGTWYPNNGAFNSGGSAVLSQDPGARATFVFSGTGVTWIANKDQWSGIARVYLDGAFVATVDTYSSSGQAQQGVYSISGMGGGTHTLVIEATGDQNASALGNWVWVDAFDVTPGGGSTTPPPATSTSTGTGSNPVPTGSQQRVEQSNSAVVLSGNWFANNGSFNSGGSAALAMDAGSRATFAFTGSSISWIGFRDQWSGIANVYIDGNLVTTVDTYSPNQQAQTVVYNVSNLASGSHTIAIEATGTKNASSAGAWVWVDAFDYVGQ